MASSDIATRKKARGLALVLTFAAVFVGLVAPPAPAVVGNVKSLDKIGYYPRLVRLAHSGEANGTILASTVGRADRQKVGKIFASRDGGRSFSQIGMIKDRAAANGRGMCCGSIYEMPRTVGRLKKGMLIWAGTFGGGVPAPKRRMSLRMWASSDHGKTWRYVSTLRAAKSSKPVYEPEFTVTRKGSLAAFYSDEFDSPRHSQVLRKTFTRDGIRWHPSQPLVTINQRAGARAGMAVPLRLPSGRYVMAYEACNLGPRQCAVYLRRSADGWKWGKPTSLGTAVRTRNGHYPTHTPNLAWSPSPKGVGSIILSSQLMVTANNRPTATNGRTLLIKSYTPKSRWREFGAPVKVPGARDDFCPNFSSAVLRTDSGRGVLHVASDYAGRNCRPYFASGPLG